MSAEQNPLIQEEYWQGSRQLYVCLAGLSGSMGMSNFEFSRSAGILDQSRIFLCDPHTSWYQHGLPGIGGSIHDIAHFLEDKLTASGARELRFVGHCMGGFAAILLCALIGRGRAIAFAPQSHFIPTDQLSWRYDTPLFRESRSEHIWDLPAWLRHHAPDTEADIHVARDFPFDVEQAKPLEGFRNIRVHYHAQGGHQLIRSTQQDGLLAKLLA